MKEEETFAEPTCQIDKSKMVYVGSWTDGEYDLALYQCPECKTVKIKNLKL